MFIIINEIHNDLSILVNSIFYHFKINFNGYFYRKIYFNVTNDLNEVHVKVFKSYDANCIRL